MIKKIRNNLKKVWIMIGFMVTVAITPIPIYAQGWSSATYTTISDMYIYVPPAWSGGEVLIQFNEMINPDSCTDGSWIHLPINHPLFKETYSMLLTANASKTKIQYLVDGCSGSGTQGKPKLRLIRMK